MLIDYGIVDLDKVYGWHSFEIDRGTAFEYLSQRLKGNHLTPGDRDRLVPQLQILTTRLDMEKKLKQEQVHAVSLLKTSKWPINLGIPMS